MTWNCTLTSLISEHSWVISSGKSFAGTAIGVSLCKDKTTLTPLLG